MYYKLAQLVLTPGRRSQTVSEIYLAQPDSIKEALAGKLFILIEVEQNNSDSLKIINFLIDNISNNYYQNEKIYLREKISSLKVEHIFEASLAKTNKNLQEYLEKEKIKISPQSINVTVGVLHEDMIHVANIGKNKVFLVYKSSQAAKTNAVAGEDEYKITDIVHGDKPAKNKIEFQDGKFFSNVISGQIPEKGIFIFTNEALPEYVSSKQLIQITTTLPPLSAVEQIKGMLTKINSYVSFLGIIIKSTTIERMEEKKETTNISTQESIEVLNRTEESTENLLAPTGIVDSRRLLSRLTGIFQKKPAPIAKNSASLKDKIFVKKKNFVVLDKVWQKIKNISIHLINIVFYLLKSLTSRQNFSEMTTQSKEKTADYFNNLKFSVISLNQKNKILLAIIIISFGIFGISTYYSNYRSQQENQRQEYSNLISQIEQRQNKIKAYSMYKDEDGVKNMVEEIKALMSSFPQETEEQKAKYQEIDAGINELNAEINKVTTILETIEVANFSNLNSNAQPQNIIYLPELNKIYAGDSAQKTIYIVDISQNLVTPITGFSEPITALTFPMATKDKKIIYLNNDNITTFDAAQETISNNKIELKTDSSKIASANVYNNNVYLLDPSDNKIYKYDKNGSVYSAPQNWLAENVDLTSGIDIAIDGSIYVLKNNGTIIKLLKGKLQNFDIKTIEPPVEQATKLIMSPDQNFIYILEPTKNRLVVFDKNGNLKKQYRSDQWQSLKDAVVDEKNKTIYLLNGSSLIKFAAQHL